MYSILNYSGKNKKGAIETVKKRQITHWEFKTSLFDRVSFVHTGTKIISDKHTLYTADVTKVILAPFNDKQWITRNGNECIALSHRHCLIDWHKCKESEYITLIIYNTNICKQWICYDIQYPTAASYPFYRWETSSLFFSKFGCYQSL